jgi:hypothetical protein
MVSALIVAAVVAVARVATHDQYHHHVATGSGAAGEERRGRPRACLPLQGPYRKNHNTPGSGLVEGDFDQVSFSGGNASLSFRVTQPGLPPLELLVMVGPVSAATGSPAVVTPPIGHTKPTTVYIPINSWDDVDWPAVVSADAGSLRRGWCTTTITRTLRKQQLPEQLPDLPALELRLNQPVVFFTDDFLASRHGVNRRLIPVTQQRVGNSSFLNHKPHHYMRHDRPLSVFNSTLSFGMKVDYNSNTPPELNPESEAYDCQAPLPAGDSLPVWSCVARLPMAPPTKGFSSLASAGTPTPMARREREDKRDPVEWPPHFTDVWPLSSTFVRFYRQDDGKVELRETQVLYTSVRHHVCSMAAWSANMSCQFGNISLLANAGYPIWQRLVNGRRETLILPVDGVPGRPLLRTETLDASTVPHIPYGRRKILCRHVEECTCDGSNVTDPSCANDNFGGYHLRVIVTMIENLD